MPEFSLNTNASFRPNAADQRHAATIARHIRDKGRVPSQTLVFRLALAKAVLELGPPIVAHEIAARIGGSSPAAQPADQTQHGTPKRAGRIRSQHGNP